MPGANYEEPEKIEQEIPATGDRTETVREITLTDKLNKKLLEAYLQRINQFENNHTPLGSQENNEEFADNDFS